MNIIDILRESPLAYCFMNQGTRAAQPSLPPTGVCCVRVPGFMRQSTTQGALLQKKRENKKTRQVAPLCPAPCAEGGGHRKEQTDIYFCFFPWAGGYPRSS